MSDTTREQLASELKASIQMNAHGGDVALDAETVECIAEAIFASIERLGLAVVPIEPNMEIVKAGKNWVGWNGWKPMVSAVNLAHSEPPKDNADE